MNISAHLPRLNRYRILLPFVFWLVLIFALSAYPRILIPQGKYVSWDKLAHIAEYAILGYLTGRVLYYSGINWLHTRWRWLAILFGLTYAISDEVHQMFVPGRFSSVFDVLADLLGILIGVWLFNRLPSFLTPSDENR